MDCVITINHLGTLFIPPIKEGVKLEREITGAPAKLTFTVVKIPKSGMNFSEGDEVCLYYDNVPMFKGYVFTKKRDREHHIEVTCYDQIRYLKNKYTYVFENKTAGQIIQMLCADFNMNTGAIDNTGYVIPAIAEENISALDIALDVLDETLVNTGNKYVLYDNFGAIEVRNVANMMSNVLICEDTAENFDYKSSIDDETYNNIVLYYKDGNDKIQIYTASSQDRINQWGVLRYFEEVKIPASAQNKANALLELYNRKTRELKITGAFGHPSIRGGTMIPVLLYLGDIKVDSYLLVSKVVHTFNHDHYTMDLTVEGAWE